MNRRQRFSLRKYKFGLASVLLGTALVLEQVKSVPMSRVQVKIKPKLRQSRQS